MGIPVAFEMTHNYMCSKSLGTTYNILERGTLDVANRREIN